MSNPTMTRKARDLYEYLRQEELVSLMFEGLMGDAVWISSGRRAYRLRDLSDGHLGNIHIKYLKNKEEVPEAIKREVERRKET